ncbi:MAG: hypothetical protein ACRC6I_13930 [Paracoccaceae bacterium]
MTELTPVVTEEVTAPAAAVIEAPQEAQSEPVDEDAAMDAIWEKMEAEGIEGAEPEPAKGEPEPALQTIVTPPDLPAGIKERWAEMPEAARNAVLASHRDLSRKLADQGRVVQASKPVFDVLVKAAQEIPSIQGMTPAQIAQDVFAMAKIQGDLVKDPVRTILGIAQQYGAIDGIKQVLAGQAPSQAAPQTAAMVQEIRRLQAQLQQVADPSAIEQRINQTLTTRDTERMVGEYATQKEHWGAVEPLIPSLIPAARQKLGESASAKDVLDTAYDMAIHADPDLRAKVQAAASAPAESDPARTAALLKAKSVNITSRPGKTQPMTEDQAMDAVWDKYRG